jgi:hypothetical protein
MHVKPGRFPGRGAAMTVRAGWDADPTMRAAHSWLLSPIGNADAARGR